MKIGILTFHYAHNYGAVLQTYALKTYVEELGHEVFVLDYRNKNVEKEYPRILRPRIPKKWYFKPRFWRKVLEEYERCIYSYKSWRIQFSKFDMFINNYLTKKSSKRWEKQYNDCDVLFFGSDQIWEKKIVGGKELVYFGNKETKAKKVSYASSCTNPDDFVKSAYFDMLGNFDSISTREESLAIAIKKVCPEYKITTVVDPVFLLGSDNYKKIARTEKKNYVLVYFVSENEELSQISQYIRNVEKKKVIEIHYFNSKKINNPWQLTDVGPEEFLGLICEATMVITNSFHGTAFSIIFNKPFWTLNSNVRIVDVLRKLELMDRQILSFDDWKEKKNNLIDYNEIEKKINNMIFTSKKFIDMALAEE